MVCRNTLLRGGVCRVAGRGLVCPPMRIVCHVSVKGLTKMDGPSCDLLPAQDIAQQSIAGIVLQAGYG